MYATFCLYGYVYAAFCLYGYLYLPFWLYGCLFLPFYLCNKGRGMCYPVCGMMHIKEPMLLIRKSSPGCSSRLPLSLSVWSFTICPMPYNHKYHVLSASLMPSICLPLFVLMCVHIYFVCHYTYLSLCVSLSSNVYVYALMHVFF